MFAGQLVHGLSAVTCGVSSGKFARNVVSEHPLTVQTRFGGVPEQFDGVLALYEQWASGRDLADHLRLPQMQAFLEQRHELLDGDLEITFLDPIEGNPDRL